ncbi:MAG: DsbA family protein [Anaerolineae bacterium]|nr:DsbA family protein [Anaerolineae bacterium]
MPRLDVYVRAGCWSCEESQRIVADMRGHFPGIEIALRDTANCSMPTDVFAVPTYVLNDQVLFVGNPSREDLAKRLSAIWPTEEFSHATAPAES